MSFSFTLQNLSKSSFSLSALYQHRGVGASDVRSKSPSHNFVDSAFDMLITVFALPFLTQAD